MMEITHPDDVLGKSLLLLTDMWDYAGFTFRRKQLLGESTKADKCVTYLVILVMYEKH
jgi:hypothetical protein